MKFNCAYSSITLDIVMGSIWHAAKDAINLSLIAKCEVNFSFNGVKLSATPITAIDDIVKKYQDNHG